MRDATLGTRGSSRLGLHHAASAMVLVAGLVVGVALFSACSNPRTNDHANNTVVVPALAKDGDSGVQGIVTIGPTCPVERADSPCPDKPYPTQVIALSSSGAELARAATDSEGRFTVALPPGDYGLSEVVSGTFPRASVVPVHVVAGSWTFVHISLDSGIR